VPGMRSHNEPLAGLAASVALVCSDSHHRSSISAFDSERTGPRDPCSIRRKQRCQGMAQSAAMASAVVGIADIVGLAGIAAGNRPAGTDSTPRPAASNTIARRDADRLGIDGKGSGRVGSRCASKPEWAGSQPAAGVADDAVPSRRRFDTWFWNKANGNAHRGRPCARTAAAVMLSSIT
jgi:hypothetical protein